MKGDYKVKIGIGTKNPAKTSAVKRLCQLHFQDPQIEEFKADSLVSNQPLSDQETLLGAKNRAKHVLELSDVELSFGLEGGVKEMDGLMYICNWGALALRDGSVFIAGGAQIPLPEEVASSIREGLELGPVMDAYTKRVGISHSEGAVGVFTDGLVNRQEMFEHILQMLIGQYKCSLSASKYT
jgi:inosine/xanthosine triphosphatase